MQLLCVFCLCCWAAGDPVLLDRPAPSLHYGHKFRAELDRPVAAAWDNVEVRSLLRRLSADRQVAMLLDRRIDPTIPLRLSLRGESLQDGAAQIASLVDAAVSVPENVIFIGPDAAARWLRTEIAHREQQLRAAESLIPEKRQLDLSARRTVHWQDLDTPAEILARVAASYDLEVENPEMIPHDLWASATLPQATAAEALVLVLLQLDLSFAWTAGGQRIQLVPFAPPPLIERRYPPRGKSAAELARSWRERHPDLDVAVVDGGLVVRGRAEDHDLVHALLYPPTPRRDPTAAKPEPLRKRQFTLRAARTPALAIMRELEKSGVVFVYDAQALENAGVDLKQPVTVEVQKASADEFFQAVFGPLKLQVQIDDVTVRLTPEP